MRSLMNGQVLGRLRHPRKSNDCLLLHFLFDKGVKDVILARQASRWPSIRCFGLSILLRMLLVLLTMMQYLLLKRRKFLQLQLLLELLLGLGLWLKHSLLLRVLFNFANAV